MRLSVYNFLELIAPENITSISNPNLLKGLGFAATTTINSILSNVSIDSRNITAESVFFALPGHHVDGHHYIAEAYDNGAIICIGSLSLAELGEKKWLNIDVDIKNHPERVYIQALDPTSLLHHIAQNYREKYLDKTIIIGVTGSAGKTTTKDLIAGALRSLKPKATEGNLNNHFGVPLTLLSLNPEDAYAVLEAGMNHRGEMRTLAEMMHPDIVVITNIGTAHIEHLETRQAIADEKADLAICSKRITTVIMPKFDEFTTYIQNKIPKTVRFIEAEPIEHIPFEIQTPGKHSMSNAWLAYHCGLLFQIPSKEIIAGIQSASITPRRLEIRAKANDVVIIDDTYNANPDSMRAGLSVLQDFSFKNMEKEKAEHGGQSPLRKIAVLGAMGELGFHSNKMHRDIMVFANSLSDINEIFLVGKEAEAYIGHSQPPEHETTKEIRYFETHEACLQYIETHKNKYAQNTVFFVKGSKFTKMGIIADALLRMFH